MSRILILIGLLAAAMLLGPFVANNPGYVKIVLAGKSFEMTVLGLVINLLLLLLALSIIGVVLKKLLRLQQISFNFFRWRKQRKAQQAYEQGVQHYLKQQWDSAVQQLNVSLADPFMVEEKRMLAAYAAFYANDSAASQRLLDNMPESENRWFLQADLLLRQHQPEQAAELLQPKVTEQPEHAALGQLYLQSLQLSGQWQLLLVMIPQALKHHWYSKAQWQQQRFMIYPAAIGELSRQHQFDEKADYWQQLPAKERKSAAAAIGLAWAMALQGQTEQAEKRLADHISLSELPLSWPYLRRIPLGRSVLKLRKQIQHWLHEHPTNGYLYAVLAYLAEQEGERQQADVAWNKALQYQPDLAVSKR